MSSVEFYFIIFFPFVFSFLFILFPKSIIQNYKYLGIIGTLSFVILWTMGFHEFFVHPLHQMLANEMYPEMFR